MRTKRPFTSPRNNNVRWQVNRGCTYISLCSPLRSVRSFAGWLLTAIEVIEVNFNSISV